MKAKICSSSFRDILSFSYSLKHLLHWWYGRPQKKSQWIPQMGEFSGQILEQNSKLNNRTHNFLKIKDNSLRNSWTKNEVKNFRVSISDNNENTCPEGPQHKYISMRTKYNKPFFNVFTTMLREFFRVENKALQSWLGNRTKIQDSSKE